VRGGSRREGEYSFRHALLQEAAYESLLRSKRRELQAYFADAQSGEKRCLDRG